MALIKCPECGKEISDQTQQCPGCGRPVSPNRQQTPQSQEPTKKCKHCQSDIPKKAKVCPVCKRKQGGALKAVIITVVVLVVILIICTSGGGSDDSKVKKAGEVPSSSAENSMPSEEEHSNIFHVGEIAETKDLRITFVSTGVYVSDNQFLQPKDGYEYREFEFIFENLSDSDAHVSTLMDWECYADDVKVDQFHNMDDNGLDATLSKGRKAQGKVYFEVPVDAQKVELEYDINFWKSDKIIFVGK